MKIIKGIMAVVALAGVALVTGCSDCAPVREEITTVSAYPAAVGEIQTIQAAPLNSCAPALNTCSPCGGGVY